MRRRRDPVTSIGLRVAQTLPLSPTMEHNLLRLLASERGGSQAALPTTQARSLERRGLITVRTHHGYGRYGGMDCDLTDKGRGVARGL